jgi:hypothetical protein
MENQVLASPNTPVIHMGARNAAGRTIRLAGERSRTYRKARQLARRLKERIASR